MLTIENMSECGFQNLKISGENIMMSCPLHIHKDNSPSFGINVETGQWNCFTCGHSGNSIESLSYILHMPELLKLFNYTSTTELVNRLKFKLNGKNIKKEETPKYFVQYYMMNYVHDYLGNRGISKEIAEKFNIGFDPIQKAVVFPVYKEEELTGFTYRLTKPGALRYIHEVEKSQTVYGSQFLKSGRVIVVEGNVDVLRAYSMGYDNVVAIMGTKLSKDQEELINKYATEIVFALDNDFNKPKNWGQMATKKIASYYLKKYSMPLSVVTYPIGAKDFGDLKTNNIKIENYMNWRIKNCIMEKC